MEYQEPEIKTYTKGEIICQQGEYESCMFDILLGSVGVYTGYGTDAEKKLTELDAGSFFGEMGLIEACPRSATVVALEDNTKVEVITAETFGMYFQDHPEKVLMMMRQMSRRIRSLTGDYLDACRALAETVESEKTGKQKSGWFSSKMKKFLHDYEQANYEALQYGIAPESLSFPFYHY